MNILNARMVRCGLCGTENSIHESAIGQPVEPPDLDTRPGEPVRSTIGGWVHRCRECGYCAMDISTVHEDAAELIGSEGYQRVLHDSAIPAKAREFLCYSMILERVGQIADAGWSSLHAAWACDDADSIDAAARCRHRALDLWKAAKRAGQTFGDDLPLEFTIVTDICRRLGHFQEATVTCSDALDSEELPPVIEAILRFERALIDKKDCDRHSLSELLASQQRVM